MEIFWQKKLSEHSSAARLVLAVFYNDRLGGVCVYEEINLNKIVAEAVQHNLKHPIRLALLQLGFESSPVLRPRI